jgi:hypothetical protein
MTLLWETYCRTVALTAILPRKIKTWFLAQRILESGRGTTRQATELLNFGGMKRKPALDALAHGWVRIDGYDYPIFWTIEEEIRYFWALVHREAYYPDVDKHIESGEDFINYIGRHGYCPPGYPGSPAHDKWVHDTGFLTYTDYIRSLVAEASAQLAKYGLFDEEDPVPIPQPIPAPIPTPVPIPTPGSLSITAGILTGPNVHYWWLKNHPHTKRTSDIGIVSHGTGCLGGISHVYDAFGLMVPGMIIGWDDKLPGAKYSTNDFAPIVNMRDGTIWQCFNLDEVANQCYNFNYSTIGIEHEVFGAFYPWQAILGRFYWARWKFWEQSIPMSEMKICPDGKYRQPYTDVQIDNFIAEVRAIRAWKAGKELFVRGHSVMPGNADRGDPGILWPWGKLQQAGI